MKFLLEKIKDPELEKLIDCLDIKVDGEKVSDKFRLIAEKYPKYDKTFLWLLCYKHESSLSVRKYMEVNYKKFHQYLDTGFLKKISKKDGFDSHMWEMILCDTLSSSGKLLEKPEAGADFLIETPTGQRIQVEAVVPNESLDKNLQSIKPDYSKGNVVTMSGKIDDLEAPVLLRLLKSFDYKAKKGYRTDIPLIIAINTHKVVGISSLDTYNIRRLLFGLGNATITKRPDDSYVHGLEQNMVINTQKKRGILLGRFRDPAYKHVSGVIYTSQSPIGLIPDGWGWSNYGITYVPNPIATNKIDLDFDFFRKIICNEKVYQETDAKKDFKSSVL